MVNGHVASGRARPPKPNPAGVGLVESHQATRAKPDQRRIGAADQQQSGQPPQVRKVPDQQEIIRGRPKALGPLRRVVVGGETVGLFDTDAQQSCPHFGGLAGPRLARVHNPSRPHAGDLHGLAGHSRNVVGALAAEGALRVFPFALGLSVLNQIEAHGHDHRPAAGSLQEALNMGNAGRG